MSSVLIFDVGGSAVKYALMNSETAEIVEKGEFPTVLGDSKKDDAAILYDNFLNALCDVFEQYKDRAEGIGFSIPGNVDSNKGHIYTSGALWYNANHDLADDLAKRIKERCGKDVLVALENDGKSCALAEMWLGNLKDCANGVVCVVGTGLGGGIMVNRQLLKGKDFFAGELSFVIGDYNNNHFSTTSAAKCSAVMMNHHMAKAKNLETNDGRVVFEYVNSRDPDVYPIFEKTMHDLACLFYNLVAIINPDKILVGGGISRQPIVVETIKEQLAQLQSDLIPIPDVEIDTCKFNNDSNLIGALYNYNLLSGNA